MNLRKGNKNDIQILYAFERAYILEHEPKAIEQWDQAKEKITSNLHASLDRMIVVEKENTLVGFGYWNLNHKKPCVSSIFINKDYRSRGYGKLIMTGLERDVKTAGYKEITLSTLKTNPAQHLFSALSYKVVEVKDGWIHYIKAL